MLFLLRPRQTYMPYALPRNQVEQEAYHRELDQAYASTRRVPPSDPSRRQEPDLAASLRELASCTAPAALSDEEFAAAKAKLLAPADGA